jgi:hypothetical protein
MEGAVLSISTFTAADLLVEQHSDKSEFRSISSLEDLGLSFFLPSLLLFIDLF